MAPIVPYLVEESFLKLCQFWGFQLKEREKKVPETFCGHDFTDDEIAALERGDVIHVDGLISKKGKEFSADISYKNGKLDLKFG